MPSQIKIYHVNEFIRLNETGIIDVERSKEIIRELAVTASVHEVDNILIDLRGTTIEGGDLSDLLDIAAEFARYKPAFRGKVATVIPADENRVFRAERLRDLIGFDSSTSTYGIFTSFEDAIDWFSETES